MVVESGSQPRVRRLSVKLIAYVGATVVLCGFWVMGWLAAPVYAELQHLKCDGFFGDQPSQPGILLRLLLWMFDAEHCSEAHLAGWLIDVQVQFEMTLAALVIILLYLVVLRFGARWVRNRGALGRGRSSDPSGE